MTTSSASTHRRRIAAMAAAITLTAVGIGACGGGADKPEKETPAKLPPTPEETRTGSDRLLDEHLQDVIEDTHENRLDATDFESDWTTP
jgi:hypothetical protein